MKTTVETPTFLLADEILRGKLASYLRAWRRTKPKPLSHDRIAQELYVMTDQKVSVSGPTIGLWLKSLDIK